MNTTTIYEAAKTTWGEYAATNRVAFLGKLGVSGAIIKLVRLNMNGLLLDWWGFLGIPVAFRSAFFWFSFALEAVNLVIALSSLLSDPKRDYPETLVYFTYVLYNSYPLMIKAAASNALSGLIFSYIIVLPVGIIGLVAIATIYQADDDPGNYAAKVGVFCLVAAIIGTIFFGFFNSLWKDTVTKSYYNSTSKQTIYVSTCTWFGFIKQKRFWSRSPDSSIQDFVISRHQPFYILHKFMPRLLINVYYVLTVTAVSLHVGIWEFPSGLGFDTVGGSISIALQIASMVGFFSLLGDLYNLVKTTISKRKHPENVVAPGSIDIEAFLKIMEETAGNMQQEFEEGNLSHSISFGQHIWRFFRKFGRTGYRFLQKFLNFSFTHIQPISAIIYYKFAWNMLIEWIRDLWIKAPDESYTMQGEYLTHTRFGSVVEETVTTSFGYNQNVEATVTLSGFSQNVEADRYATDDQISNTSNSSNNQNSENQANVADLHNKISISFSSEDLDEILKAGSDEV
ncbi:hypothetical protein HK100_009475 [Physocladia obscura]|uniref:Uncharacterized protein n=1 Tax=Physocladia obscura TaxID=109957 RepID=A0AAD5XHY8_9FUNG|nr:hypothetical protein HK100_009475 [Physocladia obscura]